jgi:hypothetical protein
MLRRSKHKGKASTPTLRVPQGGRSPILNKKSRAVINSTAFLFGMRIAYCTAIVILRIALLLKSATYRLPCPSSVKDCGLLKRATTPTPLT